MINTLHINSPRITINRDISKLGNGAEFKPILNTTMLINSFVVNYPTINNWNQLEVMTWNIKTFPLNDNTLYDVQEIIADIMPDIINFQEISDFSEHEELSALLPAYEFIFPSDDPYYGLDIAFRKDIPAY